MKIQGKITIINSISIAISFFVFALGLFFYLFFFADGVDHDYYRSRYLIYNTFQSFYSVDQLEELNSIEIDKGTAFVIFEQDTQRILLTSSDGDLGKGFVDFSLVDFSIDQFLGQLLGRFSETHENFFIETIENHTLKVVLLFLRIRPCQGLPTPFNPFFWVFAISGTVIFVATFLSAIFLQRTSRNIYQLEQATHRIANGDWNEPLKPVGGDELSRLVHSFNRMQQRLINERSIRYHFLMGISHDLKTPLTTIEGYLSAVKDGVILSEDFPKVIDRILNKTDLLKHRIFKLIDYVRMQTGEWAISVEQVVFKELLDEFIPIYIDETRLAERNFEIQYLAPEKLTLSLDPTLFSRLLENLINNAIKYSFPYSLILLKVVKNRAENGLEQIQVFVQNECEAIPQDQLKFLFEPFYRYANARNESGFGLGLSIVKSIVDVHNWTIEVQLHENKLEFIVSMPL